MVDRCAAAGGATGSPAMRNKLESTQASVERLDGRGIGILDIAKPRVVDVDAVIVGKYVNGRTPRRFRLSLSHAENIS